MNIYKIMICNYKYVLKFNCFRYFFSLKMFYFFIFFCGNKLFIDMFVYWLSDSNSISVLYE